MQIKQFRKLCKNPVISFRLPNHSWCYEKRLENMRFRGANHNLNRIEVYHHLQ